MDVRVGLWRKLSTEEVMLLNYGVGEDSWESLGLARRSNQSILKEISPEYSLERLMLKLKLQYFGHLMQRDDSLEKTLMLGKIEGGRRRGWQRMRWLDGITDSLDIVWVNSRSWWWAGRPGVLQSLGSQRVRHDWATNWTKPMADSCWYILLIHVDIWQKTTKSCKAIILQLKNFFWKLKILGNSLAIRCLGLCASTAGGPGSIPGQGTKILKAMQCS